MGIEGSLGEVGHAASPLDGTLGGTRLASNPAANLDLHGSLGVLDAALGAGQSADDVAINQPLDAFVGPVDRVLVAGGHGAADGVESTAVEGVVGVAAAKVVGLGLVVVVANPLPVNLIEVLRLEDEGGDDTGARSGLNLDVDVAEEDVLVGLEGRGLLDGLDGEDGALFGVVLDVGAGDRLDGVASRSKGARDGALAESRVGRAGCEL